MPIAAIYDIHGNLPALEAVIEEIRQAGVDHVVIGGDVVPGPMPFETLAHLLSLEIPVHFILGNGEVAVLEQMAGKEAANVSEQFREIIRWTAKELDPEHEHLLASWPKTLRLEISGLGEVLFCHATPRNENEVFTALTPDDRLSSIFDGIDAPVVVARIGSYLDQMFSFDIRLTIERKRLSAFALRIIRRLKILQHIMSCNRLQRMKCSKYLRRQN